MSKHTPGPWWSDNIEVGTVPLMEVKVARVSGRDASEAKANARLIAASPELLEALEEMTGLASGPVGGVTVQMKRDILAKARAAIAKARGEA